MWVNGLGKRSTKILNTLGISADELKGRVKKSGDFMKEAIELVNKELDKQGDLALTSADKATQASVKWENAQLRVGQRFQWLGELWTKISGNIADSITSFATETTSVKKAIQE